jgi:hypothetical protein
VVAAEEEEEEEEEEEGEEEVVIVVAAVEQQEPQEQVEQGYRGLPPEGVSSQFREAMAHGMLLLLPRLLLS